LEQALMTILRRMMNEAMPTLAALSAHVGMPAQMLQRRLAELHTSIQRLLRQVLRESADEQPGHRRLSRPKSRSCWYWEESAFSPDYRS
jgi:AraC-like DNA-binding protein